MTVLFYVSGHGYGHAVRMAEVMRELGRMRPAWEILVRTQSPRHLYPEDARYSSAGFDSGVVEREAGVVMDADATLLRLKGLLAEWDSLVESEIGFVRQNAVDLIVADIPPMAGDIAHGAGVPCIGISNFTWDWIYEPYAPELLGRLETAYSRMDVLLRLPFAQSGRVQAFRHIVDAPLIARRADAPQDRPPGSRVRALLGSRAKVSDEALARARQEAPEFEFVVPPVGAGFIEALASCDVVIAKLGFSMVAECIAARKPMLYPPRINFREEEILQAQAPEHLALLTIPLADFYGGHWVEYLRRLVAMPPVSSPIRTDGGEFCARFLADYAGA